MKSNRLKNWLEIIVMVLMLGVAILAVTKISTHQYSSHEVRVKNFFAMKENTLDVINIGASEIYTGFSPEYMWKNHGITSYNVATAGAPMGLAENQIKAALQTQNPKLFVISINGTQYDDKRAVAEGYLRMWIDNMPESAVRREAINKLVEGEKTSFRFKALKYHTNILRFVESFELTKREIEAEMNKKLLTITTVDGMASQNEKAIQSEDIRDISQFKEKTPLGNKTKKQFESLLSFIEKENIKDKVVFVNMPVYFSKTRDTGLKSRRKHNEAMEILKSRGFKVYDFTTEMASIGLDSRQDFYNWGHLNVLGQRKMTEYFYQRVLKDLNIKSDIDVETAQKWDENYEIYEKFFAWASNIILNEEPKPIKYDYKAIEHIVDGTMEKYEKFLRKKADIILEKRRGDDDKEKQREEGKKHGRKKDKDSKGKHMGR